MASSKKTIVHNIAQSEILSLKDGAYKQAQANDTVADFAAFVVSQFQGFGTSGFKLPDEAKTEIYDGYRMRFAQKSRPARLYAVIGGDYFDMDKLSPDQKDKVKEKIEMSVSVALSYTSNEFGKLANDQPKYHALVGEWRSATSTYCSNRFKDLEKAARDILSGGTKKKRKANLSFTETVDSTFDALKTKLAKCIANKTDSTADQEKFNKAMAAFLTVWKA
jgi:hypothetical protein